MRAPGVRRSRNRRRRRFRRHRAAGLSRACRSSSTLAMNQPSLSAKFAEPDFRSVRARWRVVVLTLLAVAILTAAGVGALLWWGDRPIREIERALAAKDYPEALRLS